MKKEYRVKKSQEFAEIMNYKKFYTLKKGETFGYDKWW